MTKIGNAERAILTLVDSVFKRLDAHNIDYCVLRNRSYIPKHLVFGSDIDLVISSCVSSIEVIELFLDLSPVHAIPRREATTIFFPVSHQLLKFDFIHHDKEWVGAVYLMNEEIIAERVVDRGIPVASNLHQTIDLVMSGLLWNGEINPKYRQQIADTLNLDSVRWHRHLEPLLGEELTFEVTHTLRLGQFDACAVHAKRMRRVLWTRTFIRTPKQTLAGSLGYLLQQAMKRLVSPGVSVAILGPDGAGKSTVCKEVARFHHTNFPFGGAHVYHLRKPVLPRLSNLMGFLRRGAESRKSATLSSPHLQSIHGQFLSVVRLTYFLLDSWLAEIRWTRHALARNQLLLFDRSLLELSVDPVRYRYGGPNWFARMVGRLSPRLDLIVLLDAPTEVLQIRKAEVPHDETERQRRAYLRMVDELPNGHVVNAGQPIDAVVRDVRQIIIDHLSDRVRHRVKLNLE